MKTKPNRVYHKGWDKYGDVLYVSGNWITCRFDGEKGTNCYEVDAPYVELIILEEKPKPEPIYDIAELVRDRKRLEWLLEHYAWVSTRSEVDAAMATMKEEDNG